MSRKIKLKLEQPQIMCAGRERVECYWRAEVIHETDDALIIEFKYQSRPVVALYNKLTEKFVDEEFWNIKIV